MKKILGMVTAVTTLAVSALGGVNTIPAVANTVVTGPTSLTFSDFAVHPYASKSGFAEGAVQTVGGPCAQTFCPTGQTLVDMEFTEDGKLIAGYGDWNGNSDSWGVPEGRVGIVPLDVEAKTWGDFIPTGTEANDNIRKYNGHLYIPTTDPSIRTPQGYHRAYSGFHTNDSGEWRFVATAPFEMLHTFDVAVDKDGHYWVFGSTRIDGVPHGVALQSKDNGVTWTAVYKKTSEGGANGWERNYWGLANETGVYTSTDEVHGVNPGNKEIHRITDEGIFINSPEIQYLYRQNAITLFNNRPIIATFISNEIKELYPGGEKNFPKMDNDRVVDFHVNGDYLYGLGASGNIYRIAEDSTAWQQIASETKANTLAIYNDYLYLGGENGKISKSNEKISDLVFAPELSSRLSVKKTTDSQNNNKLDTGDTVEYALTLNNVGIGIAHNLNIVASKGTPTIQEKLSNNSSTTVKWTYTIQESDMDDQTHLTNQVKVKGYSSDGTLVETGASVKIPLEHPYPVYLSNVKTILKVDKDNDGKVSVGDSISIEGNVRNFYSAVLNSVRVTSNNDLKFSCRPTVVNSGETTTCVSDDLTLSESHLGDTTFKLRPQGITRDIKIMSGSYTDYVVTVHPKSGVKAYPKANDVTKYIENPGGSTKVQVPTLSGINEDGENFSSGSSVKLYEVSSNAKLYYNWQRVNSGKTITNYDPAKLTVDPNDGVQNFTFKYTIQNESGDWSEEKGSVSLTFAPPAKGSISGSVWNDKDRDGVKDTNEALPNITITLKGSNGVTKTTRTGSDGVYKFDDLDSRVKYTLTESQPYGYLNLKTVAGDAGGKVSPDRVSNIILEPGMNATGYDFLEWSLIYR